MDQSGLTIGANFFISVYGNNHFSNIFIPLCIAASAFGNVLAVTFANSRVKQELGKEGVLPFSSVWASQLPQIGTPAAALCLHWVVSVLVVRDFHLPMHYITVTNHTHARSRSHATMTATI
jgi:amino acid transporter